MKKVIGFVILIVILVSATMVIAEKTNVQATGTSRYMACDNVHGGWFFWVDTTSGKTWRVGYKAPKIVWVYIGQAYNGKIGKIGTYIPYPNKNGSGLFILNKITGEGWYMDGSKWTKGKKIMYIGIPEATGK